MTRLGCGLGPREPKHTPSPRRSHSARPSPQVLARQRRAARAANAAAATRAAFEGEPARGVYSTDGHLVRSLLMSSDVL